MHIPFGLYGPQLEKESFEIARREREQDFEASGIAPAFESDNYPVAITMTNVHMVSGDPNPRLRRADIPNPNIDPSLSRDLVERHNEEYKREVLGNNSDTVREYSRLVAETCDEIERAESGLLTPAFRTLSLFVIYGHENQPFSVAFTSRSFAQALALRWPEIGDLEAIPDDALKQLHSLKAEQNPDTPSFEEWREQTISGAKREEEEVGTLEVSAAMGFMRLVMPTEEAAHPVVNAELFKSS
jgi:hypothetical protein